MTLLSNISILVLILAVIAISMLYDRLLKRYMKEIEEREKEIAGLDRQNKGYEGGRKQDFHHSEENP